MLQKYKISSESVCQGHPDKLCDAVSDTVLDAYLAQDPEARVACETMATNGLLVIAGEVSSEASVDIEALARRAAAEAGLYRQPLRFFRRKLRGASCRCETV